MGAAQLHEEALPWQSPGEGLDKNNFHLHAENAMSDVHTLISGNIMEGRVLDP